MGKKRKHAMSSADAQIGNVVGIDPHKHSLSAAVVDQRGGLLGCRHFPVSAKWTPGPGNLWTPSALRASCWPIRTCLSPHSPVGPLPPIGNRVVFELMNSFRYHGAGRLAEEWSQTDSRSVLRQFGAEGR